MSTASAAQQGDQPTVPEEGKEAQAEVQAAASDCDEASTAATFSDGRGISETSQYWSLQAEPINGDSDDGRLMKIDARLMSLHSKMFGIHRDALRIGRGISQTTSHWSLQAVPIKSEDDKEGDTDDGWLMKLAARLMSLHRDMFGMICDTLALVESAIILDLRSRPNPAPLWLQGMFAAAIMVSGGLAFMTLRWSEEKKPKNTVEKLFPSLVSSPAPAQGGSKSEEIKP